MDSVITNADPAIRWNAIYLGARPQRWWPSEPLVKYIGNVYGIVDGGKGLRALELGCGNGRNLWFLSQCGFDVYGLDVSSAVLAMADTYLSARHVSNPHLGRADLTNGLTHCIQQAFGEIKFDFILDDRTIQHTMWSQHLPLYKEACDEALNPGGRFFMQHLAEGCTDMRYGVGTFVDVCTAENVSGPNTVFPDNGLVCMPKHDSLVECVEQSGLVVELAEQLYHMTVSPQNVHLVTHYSLIGARK